MHGFGVDPGSPVNRAHPLNRGLVSWWLALPNQARGVIWRDLIGRNHGTLTSMDPATDWLGARGRRGGFGCLDIDATNDYVDLGGAVVLTSGQPYTISWWEFAISDSLAYPSRFVLDVGGASEYFVVIRGRDSAHNVMAWGKAPSTAVRATGAPTTASSVGIWRHWVICGTDPMSGTPSNHACYTDGVAYATSSSGEFGTYAANRIGWIGAPNEATDVRIDDVRIWSRALSAGEVRALYRESIAGYPETLNWLRFGRVAGQQDAATVYSYTGTGGAISAGAATVSRTFAPSVSGGATAGGAATVSRTLAYTPLGGAEAAGVALVSRTMAYVPSGGAVSGGAALVARTFDYETPAAGGVTGGSATVSRILRYTPSGGGVSGGAATVTFEIASTTWEYTGSGGGVAAGAAVISRTLTYLASGGATAAGAATTSVVYPLDMVTDGHTTLGPKGTLDLYSDGHTPLGPPGG